MKMDTDKGRIYHLLFSIHFHPTYLCACRSALTVARFDPSGKHIFVGTSHGTILVFNSRTKTVCTGCGFLAGALI